MASRLTLAALDRYEKQARDASTPPPAPPAPTQAFVDPEFLPRPRQPALRPPQQRLAQPQAKPNSNEPSVSVQARSLKCSCALDPTGLVNVSVREGTPHVDLKINVGGRVFSASVNAKSVRKAVAMIKETGPDNVIVTVQGQLSGDVLGSAGLSIVPTAPTPAAGLA